MKVIYHPKFKDSSYANDPAAEEGRITSILEEVREESYLELVKPSPLTREKIELVHTTDHVLDIEKRSKKLYDMSCLAAGGAVEAASFAYEGKSSFALIRPPGHHASPDSSWGFCYFNNMALAIENLRYEDKITSAVIVDFDLHTGDGNINCLDDDSRIKIINPKGEDRKNYLEKVRARLNGNTTYDIMGVSAGFDKHIKDWGGVLHTEDYKKLGEILKDFSEAKCGDKRFALLEGGYNHQVLGKNVKAFIKGIR